MLFIPVILRGLWAAAALFGRRDEGSRVGRFPPCFSPLEAPAEAKIKAQPIGISLQPLELVSLSSSQQLLLQQGRGNPVAHPRECFSFGKMGIDARGHDFSVSVYQWVGQGYLCGKV